MTDRPDVTGSEAAAAPEASTSGTEAGASTAAEVAGSAGDAELDAVKKERDELQDRLLRKAAEFDNYRKRVERERSQFVQAAAGDVLEQLLPILDNFERALKTEAAADTEAYRKGVELIYKQLLELLARRGATPIEAVGKDFDPNFHQAITHEACAGCRDGEVFEEVRRGYMLGERLLRPAMVKVAKA
jgi:molecular chaperone GrpE